ncbi:holin [Streptomyces sp. NPDC058471]|uniref:holin n=1 Tax=Streptomyces sp. NPDC058471 TaxID=3346516 RepID=UPI003646F1BC
MFGFSKEALRDVAERAVRTFVQTFLAVYAPVVLGAGSLGGLGDLSTADKAATAGIAAVFSIVMGLVGAKTGSSEDDASVR